MIAQFMPVAIANLSQDRECPVGRNSFWQWKHNNCFTINNHFTYLLKGKNGKGNRFDTTIKPDAWSRKKYCEVEWWLKYYLNYLSLSMNYKDVQEIP